ncbi:MAG: transporter substrate-binding domain-containing protein, partial [Paraglaciecola sp.]|nr:transporter substrate-binding domain-containing protein [Paraglaciecola sp.]
MINHPIKQLLIAVSLLCYAIPSRADSKITLYYNSQQKPKAWKDQQGKAQGFAFEVAAAILKTAQISYIAKGVPFNRGLELTKQCRGIMTGVFKTDKRQQFLSYSIAIVPDEAVVITRADSQFRYEKIDDLRGRTIAYLRGAVFGNKFEQAVSELKAVTLQNPSTILKVLVKGRVDVAILNPGRAT